MNRPDLPASHVAIWIISYPVFFEFLYKEYYSSSRCIWSSNGKHLLKRRSTKMNGAGSHLCRYQVSWSQSPNQHSRTINFEPETVIKHFSPKWSKPNSSTSDTGEPTGSYYLEEWCQSYWAHQLKMRSDFSWPGAIYRKPYIYSHFPSTSVYLYIKVSTSIMSRCFQWVASPFHSWARQMHHATRMIPCHQRNPLITRYSMLNLLEGDTTLFVGFCLYAIGIIPFLEEYYRIRFCQ